MSATVRTDWVVIMTRSYAGPPTGVSSCVVTWLRR
jgi:hypothetical protein